MFRRKTFGMDTKEAEGQVEGEDFYKGEADRFFDLNMFELGMATASPVTRWREANPEKVGTEDDVVRRMRRTIERFLWEAGVEKGKESVRSGNAGVLLMLKKQA